MPLVTMAQNLKQALKKAEIVPSIVRENFSASTLLGIDYGGGKDVALGNFIKPSDAAKPPKLSFVAPDESAQYSLLMVDPDAPSKQDPKWGPYRHWVLTNVPGSADFTQASELAPYKGPAPPPKTGDHRYIFLLYKQPKTQADFGTLAKESNNWDFQSFVNKNDLELVAVNFFVSRNDDN